VPRPVSRFLILLTVTLITGPLAAPCLASDGNDDASLRTTISNLAASEGSLRSAAIKYLSASKDTRILPVLEHYKESSLFLWKDQLVLCPKMDEDEDGNRIAPLQDVLTGQPLTDETGHPRIVPKSELKEVIVRRPDRRNLESAIRVHSLFAADLGQRLSAVQQLGLSNNLDFLKSLQEVLEADNPSRIHYAAEEGIWLLRLSNRAGDRESLVKAARMLADLHSARGGNKLTAELKRMDQLQADQQKVDLELRTIYQEQVSKIETYQYRVGLAKNFFNGISTGSVLVLIALGLAIIFGQMGVINMAHGELVMLGAYATYVTQLAVGHTPDHPINWFFIVALPVSFIVTALAGLLIEYLVVRHLYKRPLESLLATWGVGLILIQFIRAGFPWSKANWAANLPNFLRWDGFGDNIGVNSPTWLVGAVSPITDLTLPYNRLFIIALTIVSVVAIAVMMRYSSLGLRIRATVQNRETASSLGVNTRRTDSYTFAIGSGLAGIAGYALTLIAGVTPDMGQNYIVDSFLVVVTGGVGKLAGSVSAGMGIGILNKFFEPISFGGALFSVGLFILVASWIMIAVRAHRLKQNQLLTALVLPPLFVYRNYQQRGLIRLLILMLVGLAITLLNPRFGFDHMIVVRGANSPKATAERLLLTDRDGTRKVIVLSTLAETGESSEEGQVDVELAVAREALKKAEGPFMVAAKVLEEAEKNTAEAVTAAESAKEARIEAQKAVKDAKRALTKTASVDEIGQHGAQKVLEDAEQALAEAARVSEEAGKNKEKADKEATLAEASLVEPQKVFDNAKHVVAEQLARLIRAMGLQRLKVVVDDDRIFMHGSQEVVFSSDQEMLGVSARTPEGYRSKPAQIAPRLPGFAYFLAIPVQTIWGKVLILLAVMMFIQWQPAGLFPPRGRLADE
jgi:urea transport system permease protein